MYILDRMCYVVIRTSTKLKNSTSSILMFLLCRQRSDGGWTSINYNYNPSYNCNGKFGEAVKFPIGLDPKGAVEPRRSNWYCAARFTCEKGNFAPLSQSTAFRVIRSCRCDCQFCAKKAPYLSVATWIASRTSNVGDYCGELTRWDTLTRELGEPCHPRTVVLVFVGGGLRYAELTVVLVRQCERLVR